VHRFHSVEFRVRGFGFKVRKKGRHSHPEMTVFKMCFAWETGVNSRRYIMVQTHNWEAAKASEAGMDRV
jgi:hypothetical protein